MKIVTTVFLLMLGLCAGSFGQTGNDVWDVFSTGARGDGKTVDTKAIQAAIDRCHESGGGQVYLHNGEFISGTLVLRSHVTLHIEAGATLRASENLADFPISTSTHFNYSGALFTEKTLIHAENAQKVSITGRGTIDGGGGAFHRAGSENATNEKPKMLVMKGCRNVQIRDVTLQNAAAWVQMYQSCRNLVIDGITVDSRENPDIEKPRYATVPGRNTDGLDLVDCEQVRIANCFINSGDDAICLKSLSDTAACRDITVTNCILSSNASGIKIGTETAGIFENITVQNCVVFDTRGEAISVMSVDGATVKNVSFSNLSLRNIKGTGIFIRLGNRNRVYHPKTGPQKPGVVQNIIISGVQGNRIGGYGCSITGIPGFPVKNIRLSGINLEFTGGGMAVGTDTEPGRALTEAERIREIDRDVPEQSGAYPSGRMFGRLPAYGFYIRHAEDVMLDQFNLSFDATDIRPAVFCEDVQGLEISNLKAEGTGKTPELIRLVQVRNALISDSAPRSSIPVFLGIYGTGSKDIHLINNRLKKVSGDKWIFKKGAKKSALTVVVPLN